jgi:2-hydroxychromene-2-carboxylate isomerase
VRDNRRVSPAAPRFYFGVMSPYSWFAAERIGELLPDAQWCGVLAGGLFKANDRVSWGLTPQRAEGIADCERRATEHGLGPIRWPEPWPTSDLLIARAMVFAERSSPGPQQGSAAADATAEERQAALKAFALAAMRLVFLEGADVGEIESVLEVGRRTGIDEQQLSEALAEQAIKDELRKITDEAVGLGVFGVPTVLVGEELFWGDDRLEEAAAAHSRSLG